MGNIIRRLLQRVTNLCENRRNKPDIIVPENYLEYLKDTTTLTVGEIRHLYIRFKMLTVGKSYLTKNDLMMVPGMQMNPINSSIIHVMFGKKKRIRFKEFAKFLHIFKAQDDDALNAQRKEQKLQLLFNMYDRNGTGTITKDELFDIVHRMFCDELDYSEILKISEIILAELDSSVREEIVFKDFRKSVGELEINTKLMLKIPEC